MAGLRLAPLATLTIPGGRTLDVPSVLQLLQSAYASEPANSTHRPDLASLVYHSTSSSELDLTFHELQTQPEPRGGHWQCCTVSTRAVCEARGQPQICDGCRTPAGVAIAWRSFVETALGCERVQPPG